MKKIYTFLFAAASFVGAQAASFTITTSGTSYSPSTLTVSIGDVVTIQASATHPLAQVDGTTWNANGTATLSTGWGVKTADHTFTVSSANTVFFVCTNHVSMGMKGQITVSSTGLVEQTKALSHVNVFPNPAQNEVNLTYQVNEKATVAIELLSVSGQLAAILLNNEQQAGNYCQKLNLPGVIAPGLYFIKISGNGKNIDQRLISIN